MAVPYFPSPFREEPFFAGSLLVSNGKWIIPVTPLLVSGERCSEPEQSPEKHAFPVPPQAAGGGVERSGIVRSPMRVWF
jgi:hypothetical protein